MSAVVTIDPFPDPRMNRPWLSQPSASADLAAVAARDGARALLLLAALSACASGCDAGGAVVLGVSSSPPYTGVARMAVEDELALAPLPGFDTVMIPQSTNLADQALEAAQRLVEVPGLIAVVGHSNSAASLATAPIYNESEVVQIAPTASAAEFSDAGPFSFRLVPSDIRQGAFLVGRLREALPDGGRLAIVYVNDDYGRGLRANLLANLSDERFRVVLELPHVENVVRDADIAYTAGALAAEGPDVVVWLARGGMLGRFIVPIREVLPRVPIIGGDAVAAEGLGNAPGEAWGDVRAVDYLDLDSSEALRMFQLRYRERFGRDPAGPDALTYDAVRLVIAGVRAGARTGPELRAYLASLGRTAPPYIGLTGPITFDDNGDVERTYVFKSLRPENTR